MPLTLQQLKDHAHLVLGEQVDPRFDVSHVVNAAGRFLYGMQSWRWRERPTVALSLTEDQAYVALPSDFGWGEVLGLAMTDTATYGPPEPTTLSALEWMRQQGTVYSPNTYWYALAYPTQTSTSAAPGAPRLELYPTPTADDADAMQLTYRAGWVELSANADAANVPPFVEGLLVRLVQAMAGERSPGLRGRIESVSDVLQSEETRAIRRMDGAAQDTPGALRGGVLQTGGGRDYPWNWVHQGVPS